MFKNFTTNRDYTGQNVDMLMASGYDEGDKFAGFHQGRKFFGVNGSQLKGLKKAATLTMVVEKEDSNGDKKKSMRYFPVFSYEEFQKTINANKNVQNSLDNAIKA